MSKRYEMKYDAAIIGTGQAGKPLAKALAEAGWKVAIIEKAEVGGSCINYGCTPTKTMIASAKAAYDARSAAELGIKTGKVETDFRKVMKRKDKVVEDFRTGSEKTLNGIKNVSLIKGTASFVNKNTLAIHNNGKRDIIIKADKIFINTGAKPVVPNIDGLDGVRYLDFHSIMNLRELPRELIIIGAGYIGLEFGQMFRRFGSRVTIIEQSDKFLTREDRDTADEIRKILEEEGINILTGAKVKSVKTGLKNNIEVRYEKNKKNHTIKGSHLLISIGVQPETTGLYPGNAGVQTDERGFIKVTGRLETNVKGIYALGDVKGGPAFTHISYDDYRIVKANLLEKKKCSAAGRLVPYVLFTDPQLGKIGITEDEAKEKKIKYECFKIPMTSVAWGKERNSTKGFIKAIADKKSGKILGCAVIAEEGGELMSMVEIAMMGNLKYTQLANAIFAHPAFAESLNTLFTK